MKMKPSRLPAYIELTDRMSLESGALFVRLQTLAELEEFWCEHRGKFAFACEGKASDQSSFLHEYEWVFGSTKDAVVRTVLHWEQSGISCEFYDWAKHDPQMHKLFFLDREAERESMIERGIWSEEDEVDFCSDCVRRSPETYRGWWRFCNLPNEYSCSEWLNDCLVHEELIDPHMAYQDVVTALHEQTFDSWRQSDSWDLESHDGESIDDLIQYWKNERAKGESYYGDENETTEAI